MYRYIKINFSCAVKHAEEKVHFVSSSPNDRILKRAQAMTAAIYIIIKMEQET